MYLLLESDAVHDFPKIKAKFNEKLLVIQIMHSI